MSSVRFHLRARPIDALSFILSAAVVTTFSIHAAGDDKIACVRAGESAQELRAQGKLMAARAALLFCSRDTCPAVVRVDCGQWLGEVDQSVPTVVVHAVDDAGSDLRDVRIVADGVEIAREIDGRPRPLDPGEHRLRFEHAGAPSVEQRIVLATGERNRLLSVHFTPPPPRPSVAAPSSTAPSERATNTIDARRRTTISPAAWVLLGGSVVALGGFAFFGATGSFDLHHLRDTCAGHCAQDDVDRAWTKLVVADVSLGVGILAGGLATFFFLNPTRAIDVTPTIGGAHLTYRGRF